MSPKFYIDPLSKKARKVNIRFSLLLLCDANYFSYCTLIISLIYCACFLLQVVIFVLDIIIF